MPGAPPPRVVWPWVSYGALMLLAGYLNEMALLALVAHGVTVLLARYGRPAFVHWAAAAVLAALLVIPLAVVSAREDAAVAWIPRPGPGSVRVLFHDYFGATTPWRCCCSCARCWPCCPAAARARGRSRLRGPVRRGGGAAA